MNLFDIKENIRKKVPIQKISSIPKTLDKKTKKLVATGMLGLMLAGPIVAAMPKEANACHVETRVGPYVSYHLDQEECKTFQYIFEDHADVDGTAALIQELTALTCSNPTVAGVVGAIAAGEGGASLINGRTARKFERGAEGKGVIIKTLSYNKKNGDSIYLLLGIKVVK